MRTSTTSRRNSVGEKKRKKHKSMKIFEKTFQNAPRSFSLSRQISSRQIPRSYSASTSKKHERMSVECSRFIRSFAFRYKRMCVAKLSTTVPVEKSNQSICFKLKKKRFLSKFSLVFLRTVRLNVESQCKDRF